jgi:uncharacterized repeat protein (TIGR02543 family)
VADTARTILPSTPNKDSFVLYTLNFTPTSGGLARNVDRSPAELSNPVYLEPGTYTLVVTAFLGPGATGPAARGSIDGLVISEGNNTNASVELRAIIGEGVGSFTYTVNFPQGLDTAKIEITPLNTTTGTPKQEVNLLLGATGMRTLNSGYYNVVFTLEKNNGETLVWRELLHVYASLESSFTKTFEDADFYKTIHTVTFVFNDEITSDASSSVVHGTVKNKPDDPTRSFTVVAGLYLGRLEDFLYYTFNGWYKDGSLYSFAAPVTGDITLTAQWTEPASHIVSVPQNNVAQAITHVNTTSNPAGEYTLLIDANLSVGAQTLSRANVNLTIIGMGSDRTITASSVPLFTINNANASLTLGDKITLQGMSSANSLVNVNNGTLYMKSGSKITGHTTSGTNGAVYVNGANSTFIMEGGEISGNRSSSTVNTASGGVYLDKYATFVMGGGTISGNSSAYSSSNNPADINIEDEVTMFSLSGNATIDALTLFCSNSGSVPTDAKSSPITIVGSYTGTVTALNLRRNAAINTVTRDWTGRQIIIAGGTYTLIANDISRFTLGKFITNAINENRPIMGNSTPTTNYRIGSSGTEMGKLVQVVLGGGTSNDPYRIYNAAELQEVGTGTPIGWTLGAHYRLMEDIDLTDIDWTPIGDYPYNLFSGSFDGYYHSITNLTITSNADFQGMFAAVSGTVKNLALIDCDVTGSDYVGGVAAGNAGTVENCSVTGDVGGNNYVGGVVGGILGGTVKNCYATGDVSGNNNVGGVVGGNQEGTVESCYATGDVIGIVNYIGGVVGGNAGGTVKNCYATGDVSGNNNVGGVVGGSEYYGTDDGTVENCYATGTVSGNDYVGGVVGQNHFTSTVKNCVGLNGQITISGNIANADYGRVVSKSDGDLTNNYGRSDMIPPTGGSWTNSPAGKDGADVNSGLYNTQGWWTGPGNWNGGAWDFAGTWEWDSGRDLPKLKGVGGQ